MLSKTPQFDKVLDEILNNLKPHTKNCQVCGSDFEIFSEDIDFYKMLRVPPPKLCPKCRMQRRMMFNTSLLKFYRKQCAAHENEKAISLFTPDSPYKIYDNDFWWNPDKWDARDFALEYDAQTPFFEQFKQLTQNAPHFAIARYPTKMVNSDYTSHSMDCKDCFLSSMIFYSENTNYSSWVLNCKDCFDALRIDHCEQSYHLIYCERCYNSIFLQDCSNCIDSYFLFDCHNCQNCFMSSNLRNKSYYFFNQPFTKEDYNKKLSAINLGDRDVLTEYLKKFDELETDAIHRCVASRRIANSLGDRISDCNRCYLGFDIMGSENNRYSEVALDLKDSMDAHSVGPNTSKCYQIMEVTESSDIKFGYFIGNSISLEYCYECSDCRDCFGCTGLKKKQYCILNKQYSEGEYWQLLDEIKTKLLEQGLYGEFFPNAVLLYPYNNTFAIVDMLLNKEQALALGFNWHDDEKDAPVDLQGREVINAKDLPKDIKDVKDDFLDKAILCKKTNKPFRIIKSELSFHRQKNLPLPTEHPQERLMKLFSKRNPYQLWQCPCSKCGKNMKTSYGPARKLKVYCENCYKAEVL